MLKTKFEDICNVAYIGKAENPIAMNDILTAANAEQLTPSAEDKKERVLLLCIDIQQDFMEGGALGVPGSIGDTERTIRFIYENIESITDIAVSIDTHVPFQVFHPCWFVDRNGMNPPPFTDILLEDLDNGVWFPVVEPIKTRNYVINLTGLGEILKIWPYHCLQGTSGCALENQFANMLYFHSVVRKSVPRRLVKGQNPLTEMYGIIKPEYDPDNTINIGFLNFLAKYDKIIIVGQAKSHCDKRTIQQILEHFSGQTDVIRKIWIFEDCMSSIPGTEIETDIAFEEFKKKGVNIVKSVDFVF